MMYQRRGYIVKSLVIALIMIEMLYLLISGQVEIYVHPRINNFIKVSVVLFAFLFFANVQMSKQLRHIYNYPYYRIVVLPFVIMAVLSIGTRIGGQHQNRGVRNEEELDNSLDIPLNQRIQNSHFQLLDSEIFNFNKLLYDEQEVLEGKIVTYTVFVHYNKEITREKNQFIAARMMMACCAADMVPNGQIVHTQEPPEWKEGTWLRLTAKIKYEYQENIEIPLARLEFISAIPTEEPVSAIVYPQF